MSLQVVYQSFLASPTASALSADASFNYITTLTTVNSSTAIIKHLATQDKLLKKKQEKILSSIESPSAICLEVETTLEFLSGGGAYLPGLDENFVADHEATFPIIHIVQFDASQRIQQIRVYWDQGSLLKLVDVIGARAKNWPIRDGKDQARLISSSVAGTAKTDGSTSRETASATNAPPISPTKSKDPHASLSLFTPREVEERDWSNVGPAVAPRASAKPPPRDYHELFPGGEINASPASKTRAPSPKKENQNSMASKGGAGKNFQPSRLFGADESNFDDHTAEDSSSKPIKAHSTKYSHFDFGDASESAVEKPASKVRGQDKRHFDMGNDKANVDSPVKNTHMGQPRRDIQTHFEMNDDPGSFGDRRPAAHSRGQGSRHTALGLYENNLYNDTELGPTPEKRNRPLASTVTNPKDRRRDFDPHFEMTDSTPGLGVKSASDNNKPVSENRSKAVQMMEPQWNAADEAPNTNSLPGNSNRNAGGKENYHVIGGKTIKNVGIKTAGNGMGGRKGTERSWGIGDESDDGEGQGKFVAGKRQQAPKDSGLWDY